MTDSAWFTALVLSKGLVLSGAGELLCGPGRARPFPGRRGVGAVRGIVRHGALLPLARRLGASPMPERRQLGAMLAAAVDAGDYGAALALVSTAGRRPDLRAEKILSTRYRFLWLGVPKSASRSLIAALRRADPEARLINDLSLDELYLVHPEARDFFSFAFLRHPCTRILSFYADKHVRGRDNPDAQRWFLRSWHGLRPGMGFAELCRWLCTPCGSDAFADRHWLSQSRQVVCADGGVPDFLGRYETLDQDWSTLCKRLRLPPVPLPRRNAGSYDTMPAAPLDAGIRNLLQRRYAEDYDLGDYGDAPPEWPW